MKKMKVVKWPEAEVPFEVIFNAMKTDSAIFGRWLVEQVVVKPKLSFVLTRRHIRTGKIQRVAWKFGDKNEGFNLLSEK